MRSVTVIDLRLCDRKKSLGARRFGLYWIRFTFAVNSRSGSSSTAVVALKFKKKWEPIAKVNPVGEIWWRPLELKTFQKWENFGTGSERIPITYAIVTATSKVKLFKSIGAVGYLNTWLPRSIFIYSNNTLLTAGCCKSELRYLKHWYRRLCVLWDQYSDIVSAEAGIWDFSILRVSFL